MICSALRPGLDRSLVTSQMKILVRRMYSSPPINGSGIVAKLLSNPDLKAEWLRDVKGMTDRYVQWVRRFNKETNPQTESA